MKSLSFDIRRKMRRYIYDCLYDTTKHAFDNDIGRMQIFKRKIQSDISIRLSNVFIDIHPLE